MDRPLLHRGMTKASKRRNNTITNRLDFSDVINKLKASIILNRYTLNIHALIDTYFQKIFLYS